MRGLKRSSTKTARALIRLAEALLEFETLDSVQIRRVSPGLPLDGNNSPPSTDDGGTPESTEKSKNPFKKPILPPITGNNPATA